MVVNFYLPGYKHLANYGFVDKKSTAKPIQKSTD